MKKLKTLNFKKIGINIIPYLIIVIVALVSMYTLFFPGLPSGDDKTFHLAQITDLFIKFNKGSWGITTNNTFFGAFGLNNYGYYAPLAHYSAAIIEFLFSWCGATTISAYKTILFISAILNGVFMYWLCCSLTKGHKKIALIGTILYQFLPYQAFCALCRQAYGEAVAISFIPLVFYAAYRIINDESFYVSPYICLCIGGACLFLSHPFTALMALTFGVIYVIFNIKKLLNKKKIKRIALNTSVSVLLCFSIVAFYLFTISINNNASIYNLNNDVTMWTTYEHVSESTKTSYYFSGFLNWEWISNNSILGPQISNLVLGLLLFIVSCALMFVIDFFVSKAPKNIYYRYVVDGAGLFLLPAIFIRRPDVFIALAFFLLIFILFDLKKGFRKSESTGEIKNKFLNADLFFTAFGIIVCMIFIFVGEVWKILPSIYYQAQFSFRLYSFLFFFCAYLFTIFIYSLRKYKYTLKVGLAMSCFIFVCAMPTLEKTTYYQEGSYIQTVADEEWVKTITYSGAQNEIVPECFYDNTFTPYNSKSLYKTIRTIILEGQYQIKNEFIYDIKDYISPAILTGEGNIQITSLNTPNATFSVNVTSDTALVQLPQFFNYDYYANYVVDNTSYNVKGQNIDGLVSFELTKGSYELNVNFSGTNGYCVARPFFYIGIGLTVAYGVVGILYRKNIIKIPSKKRTIRTKK